MVLGFEIRGLALSRQALYYLDQAPALFSQIFYPATNTAEATFQWMIHLPPKDPLQVEMETFCCVLKIQETPLELVNLGKEACAQTG
jgi:hypothetical protein